MAEVEALAAQLYGSETSNAQRAEAERQLSVFSSNPEMLDQARMILETSQLSYAQHLAATSMTKLLTANWGRFSAQQRIDMRQYVRFNPHLAPSSWPRAHPSRPACDFPNRSKASAHSQDPCELDGRQKPIECAFTSFSYSHR